MRYRGEELIDQIGLVISFHVTWGCSILFSVAKVTRKSQAVTFGIFLVLPLFLIMW